MSIPKNSRSDMGSHRRYHKKIGVVLGIICIAIFNGGCASTPAVSTFDTALIESENLLLETAQRIALNMPVGIVRNDALLAIVDTMREQESDNIDPFIIEISNNIVYIASTLSLDFENQADTLRIVAMQAIETSLLFDAAYLDESIALLQLAIDIIQMLPENQRGNLLPRLIAACYKIGDAAFDILRDAEAVAIVTRDLSLRFELLIAISTLHFEHQFIDESYALLQHAIPTAMGVISPFQRISMLLHIALQFLHFDEQEQSLKYRRKALDMIALIHTQRSELALNITLWKNIASTLTQLNLFDEAAALADMFTDPFDQIEIRLAVAQNKSLQHPLLEPDLDAHNKLITLLGILLQNAADARASLAPSLLNDQNGGIRLDDNVDESNLNRFAEVSIELGRLYHIYELPIPPTLLENIATLPTSPNGMLKHSVAGAMLLNEAEWDEEAQKFTETIYDSIITNGSEDEAMIEGVRYIASQGLYTEVIDIAQIQESTALIPQILLTLAAVPEDQLRLTSVQINLVRTLGIWR